MLIRIHAEITQVALDGIFDPKVLRKIIQANLKQDSILLQIGHEEIHFDNNRIEEGLDFINKQRNLIFTALDELKLKPAWQAFGRLLHTVQDLYAHSNYVDLWLNQYAELPPPGDIKPLDLESDFSKKLQSGKLYYPLELLSFVPPLSEFALKRLPHDSHAWMNLDSPASGSKFIYAKTAAVKHTKSEYDRIRKYLKEDILFRFING